MTAYIHELKEWPRFRWDEGLAAKHLAPVRHRQGRLIGRMEALGFDLRAEAVLQRSRRMSSNPARSKARSWKKARYGPRSRDGWAWTSVRWPPPTGTSEGVVEMMLDATQKYAEPLSDERLFAWHAALFPTRAQRHDQDHGRRVAR